MTRKGEWPPAPEALPSPVADNHCHLEWPVGDEPRSVERQLADAAQVGVDRVVQIGCDIASARWTASAVEEYPAMLGGVAIHPNEAPAHSAGEHATGLSYEDAFAEIAALARGERIRVIGETGLDYFRTGPEGHEAQVRSFRDHIALAKELNKPLQIHDRDAHGDVIDVLERDGAPEMTVFHCFSGDAGMARLCADRGYYLSFAGTVTFKNSHGLRAALSVTPLSRVLVETDAPFLTPHPYRGAPNSPYLIPVTMQTIADVTGVTLETACESVSDTSNSLYGPW
ncbi:TatD family hydrolase [Demequina aurantiaca]|uniref:TatD family hydrolase n=1 Tax=Demequina aurantiaca TaxID=676200 RepID=UPI003D333797